MRTASQMQVQVEGLLQPTQWYTNPLLLDELGQSPAKHSRLSSALSSPVSQPDFVEQDGFGTPYMHSVPVACHHTHTNGLFAPDSGSNGDQLEACIGEEVKGLRECLLKEQELRSRLQLRLLGAHSTIKRLKENALEGVRTEVNTHQKTLQQLQELIKTAQKQLYAEDSRHIKNLAHEDPVCRQLLKSPDSDDYGMAHHKSHPRSGRPGRLTTSSQCQSELLMPPKELLSPTGQSVPTLRLPPFAKAAQLQMDDDNMQMHKDSADEFDRISISCCESQLGSQEITARNLLLHQPWLSSHEQQACDDVGMHDLPEVWLQLQAEPQLSQDLRNSSVFDAVKAQLFPDEDVSDGAPIARSGDVPDGYEHLTATGSLGRKVKRLLHMHMPGEQDSDVAYSDQNISTGTSGTDVAKSDSAVPYSTESNAKEVAGSLLDRLLVHFSAKDGADNPTNLMEVTATKATGSNDPPSMANTDTNNPPGAVLADSFNIEGINPQEHGTAPNHNANKSMSSNGSVSSLSTLLTKLDAVARHSDVTPFTSLRDKYSQGRGNPNVSSPMSLPWRAPASTPVELQYALERGGSSTIAVLDAIQHWTEAAIIQIKQQLSDKKEQMPSLSKQDMRLSPSRDSLVLLSQSHDEPLSTSHFRVESVTKSASMAENNISAKMGASTQEQSVQVNMQLESSAAGTQTLNTAPIMVDKAVFVALPAPSASCASQTDMARVTNSCVQTDMKEAITCGTQTTQRSVQSCSIQTVQAQHCDMGVQVSTRTVNSETQTEPMVITCIAFDAKTSNIAGEVSWHSDGTETRRVSSQGPSIIYNNSSAYYATMGDVCTAQPTNIVMPDNSQYSRQASATRRGSKDMAALPAQRPQLPFPPTVQPVTRSTVGEQYVHDLHPVPSSRFSIENLLQTQASRGNAHPPARTSVITTDNNTHEWHCPNDVDVHVLHYTVHSQEPFHVVSDCHMRLQHATQSAPATYVQPKQTTAVQQAQIPTHVSVLQPSQIQHIIDDATVNTESLNSDALSSYLRSVPDITAQLDQLAKQQALCECVLQEALTPTSATSVRSKQATKQSGTPKTGTASTRQSYQQTLLAQAVVGSQDASVWEELASELAAVTTPISTNGPKMAAHGTTPRSQSRFAPAAAASAAASSFGLLQQASEKLRKQEVAGYRVSYSQDMAITAAYTMGSNEGSPRALNMEADWHTSDEGSCHASPQMSRNVMQPVLPPTPPFACSCFPSRRR